MLVLCRSILDLRELFHGGRVPLTKTAATWQLSLENLPNLLEGLDSQRRDAKGGMSYEDYLQVLLLSKSKVVKLTRGMDMIEVEIAVQKERKFPAGLCIEAAEISVDVEANRKQTFFGDKGQYSYILKTGFKWIKEIRAATSAPRKRGAERCFSEGTKKANGNQNKIDRKNKERTRSLNRWYLSSPIGRIS